MSGTILDRNRRGLPMMKPAIHQNWTNPYYWKLLRARRLFRDQIQWKVREAAEAREATFRELHGEIRDLKRALESVHHHRAFVLQELANLRQEAHLNPDSWTHFLATTNIENGISAIKIEAEVKRRVREELRKQQ